MACPRNELVRIITEIEVVTECSDRKIILDFIIITKFLRTAVGIEMSVLDMFAVIVGRCTTSKERFTFCLGCIVVQ